ncbi:MAG: phosphotransferase [Rhodospirillaceae bacterium]
MSDTVPASSSAPESLAVLERLGVIFSRQLGGNGDVELISVISGNVNTILKLRYEGRELGVRLALNTYRFKYEKDIIKEIFALFLIYHASDAENDMVARGIVDGILASPVGSYVGHTLVRRVLYYDWSMETLPWPFFIFEWVDGTILWHTPSEDDYFTAGCNLARLHRITFDSYYHDIFSIGREPLSWVERFGRALAAERLLAASLLPAVALAKLDGLDLSLITPARPCLVHNDYSGGNILKDGDGGQKIIDWDNWVVEAPELDLLKMKYWTAIGTDGMLCPVPVLYSAFLQGYNDAAGVVPDGRRLCAYETLWLTRAFTFESARRSGPPTAGTDLARHYPPATTYEDWLRDL